MAAEFAVFTCPCCGARSAHISDLEQQYCAKCHWWTGDPTLGPAHLDSPCDMRPEPPHLYRGDIVTFNAGPMLTDCIVRQVEGRRVKVQIGGDYTWAFSGELAWHGETLMRLPWTDRGWRKLGLLIMNRKPAERAL